MLDCGKVLGHDAAAAGCWGHLAGTYQLVPKYFNTLITGKAILGCSSVMPETATSIPYQSEEEAHTEEGEAKTVTEGRRESP